MKTKKALFFYCAACAISISALLATTANAMISLGGDVYPADPLAWYQQDSLSGLDLSATIGQNAFGTITIGNGDNISNSTVSIGNEPNSTGLAIVNGIGSTWTISWLYIGQSGNGTLNIQNGGTVTSTWGYLGEQSSSTGSVTVDGDGSAWTTQWLQVGRYGRGILHITNGGLVTSRMGFSIDHEFNINQSQSPDLTDDNSLICMSSGGMLAVPLQGPDSPGMSIGSLPNEDIVYDLSEIQQAEVISVETPSEASQIGWWNSICWWDTSLGSNGNWASLSTAELGVDYKIESIAEGEFAGYSLLTVLAPSPVVPEPSTALLLASLIVISFLVSARKHAKHS